MEVFAQKPGAVSNTQRQRDRDSERERGIKFTEMLDQPMLVPLYTNSLNGKRISAWLWPLDNPAVCSSSAVGVRLSL